MANKNNTIFWIIGIVVVALLIGPQLGLFSTAPPNIPMGIYGYLEDSNGNPYPVGTKISFVSDGTKLKIQGEGYEGTLKEAGVLDVILLDDEGDFNGKKIYFYINGKNTGKSFIYRSADIISLNVFNNPIKITGNFYDNNGNLIIGTVYFGIDSKTQTEIFSYTFKEGSYSVDLPKGIYIISARVHGTPFSQTYVKEVTFNSDTKYDIFFDFSRLGSCSSGQIKCEGYGYYTCSNGVWQYEGLVSGKCSYFGGSSDTNGNGYTPTNGNGETPTNGEISTFDLNQVLFKIGEFGVTILTLLIFIISLFVIKIIFSKK